MRTKRLFLAPLLALVALTLACAPGTVTTSTGAVVPASTVQAQDLVADGLDVLRQAHAAACATHDRNVATDDPAAHLRDRQLLLDSGNGLRTAYGALIAWKLSNGGVASPKSVLDALKPSAPSLLELLVRLKVMTPEMATQMRSLIGV